jgi:hypothetical protein
MANYNVSITQSIEAQPANISASQETTFTIANPLSASSYFTLETARNNNGFYDSTSPKNTSGSFSLGTGLLNIIQSDYITSVIVAPGGGTLTFTPANDITGSTLYLRGIGSNEGKVFPPIPPIIWDVDALAYVEVIENTESIPLSYQEKNAVNNLFIRMKGLDSNYGNYNNTEIWDRRIALYPYVGSDVRAFRYNAIVPTTSSQFDINGNPIAPGYQTFLGGGTYDRYGFKGNGVNAYVNTNLNQTNGYLASSSLTQQGYTMGIVWKDNNLDSRNDFGVYSTLFPNDATMWLRNAPTPFTRTLAYDLGVTGSGIINGGAGHWLIVNNNLSGIRGAYYNKTKGTLTGDLVVRNQPPTQGWVMSYFGNCMNFNGNPGNFTINTSMFFYIFTGFSNETIINAWNQIVEDFCVESDKKTW